MLRFPGRGAGAQKRALQAPLESLVAPRERLDGTYPVSLNHYTKSESPPTGKKACFQTLAAPEPVLVMDVENVAYASPKCLIDRSDECCCFHSFV